MMHSISPCHVFIPAMSAYSFTMHHLASREFWGPDRDQGGYYPPEPVDAVAFPAAAVMRTLAQNGEAIRGIQGHLLGLPIQEELTALRFRVDIAEADNASLRARIKTNEAVEKITRNHEGLARIGIEQQLATIQESHSQDREDFSKLKEFVTSQFGQRS
ncbi:hypothetical protein Tco_0960326 [Tanacetum coccineum]